MREEPFSVRGEESGQVDPRKTSTGSTPIFTAPESWQCEKVHGSSQKNTVGVNPKCCTQRAGLSSHLPWRCGRSWPENSPRSSRVQHCFCCRVTQRPWTLRLVQRRPYRQVSNPHLSGICSTLLYYLLVINS